MNEKLLSVQTVELSRLIGLVNALKLSKKLGGLDLFIWDKEESLNKKLIASVIGEQAAEVFCKEYRGEVVYFSKNERLFKALKKKRFLKTCLNYLKEGFPKSVSIRLASRDLRISEATGRKWHKQAVSS